MIHITELDDRYVAEIHWMGDQNCFGELDACMASLFGALTERFEDADDAKAVMMIACLKAVDGVSPVEIIEEHKPGEEIIEMLKEAIGKEGST